jgi:hypothetical protein
VVLFLHSLYSTLLLVNFSLIVFGCRLVKSNHLNFRVLCDCVIFYSLLFYFFGVLKFEFVTTQPIKQIAFTFIKNKK